MAEALGPTHLQRVVPSIGSGRILVDDSVGWIGFGRKAGCCGALVGNCWRPSRVVSRMTIVRTTVDVSQDGRWVSFFELNNVDSARAYITCRHGLAAGKFTLNRQVPLIVG